MNLNHILRMEIEDYIIPEIRDKIRQFLLENCSGNFYTIYGPSSIINEQGAYEILDKSYLIIFFENKNDLIFFKLKWDK